VRSIITIPNQHEKTALELCEKLIKQGSTFSCRKTATGWEFEVEVVA